MEVEFECKSEDISTQTLGPSTSQEQPATKLGICEVCSCLDAKYSCPRCEVKTCSLKCNKIHKLELECSGQRDRTKFIPLNKFSNLDLSSDYRLLEEITRNLQVSKKTFGKHWENIPPRLFKLRNEAKLRKTNLKFLPYKFARHRSNTSYYNNNEKAVHWHIDWIFVNADNTKSSDARVGELEKLGVIISKYLSLPDDDPLAEKLQFYKSVGIPGLKFLLKAEQKSGKKFYELDPTLSLRECLERKLVIEYPTIHVVFKDHGSGYNVIDSDDEDMKESVTTKSGREVVDNIVAKAENEDNLYKSLRNLLFISEYSDEEALSD